MVRVTQPYFCFGFFVYEKFPIELDTITLKCCLFTQQRLTLIICTHQTDGNSPEIQQDKRRKEQINKKIYTNKFLFLFAATNYWQCLL